MENSRDGVMERSHVVWREKVTRVACVGKSGVGGAAHGKHERGEGRSGRSAVMQVEKRRVEGTARQERNTAVEMMKALAKR